MYKTIVSSIKQLIIISIALPIMANTVVAEQFKIFLGYSLPVQPTVTKALEITEYVPDDAFGSVASGVVVASDKSGKAILVGEFLNNHIEFNQMCNPMMPFAEVGESLGFKRVLCQMAGGSFDGYFEIPAMNGKPKQYIFIKKTY